MNDILDDFRDADPTEFIYDKNLINENNFWWKILAEPRQTFNYILATGTSKYLALVYLLSLFSIFLEKELGYIAVFELDIKIENPLFYGLFDTFLSGGMTLIFIYIIANLGKTIGGKGSLYQIFIVYVWALVPSLLLLPVYLFEKISAISGIGLPDFYIYEGFSEMRFFLIFIIGIWSFILSVIGVAIAHRISGGKSCLIQLVVSILIVIPLVYFLSGTFY